MKALKLKFEAAEKAKDGSEKKWKALRETQEKAETAKAEAEKKGRDHFNRYYTSKKDAFEKAQTAFENKQALYNDKVANGTEGTDAGKKLKAEAEALQTAYLEQEKGFKEAHSHKAKQDADEW